MEIVHDPIFDTTKVTAHYTEQEGVAVKYVCSTELPQGSSVVDIYFRPTPHPTFRNRYFGLFMFNDAVHITNADSVENLTFGMVVGDDNKLHYSQHQHDYHEFANGNMIDGGRAYIRTSGDVLMFKVMDGEFVHLPPIER